MAEDSPAALLASLAAFFSCSTTLFLSSPNLAAAALKASESGSFICFASLAKSMSKFLMALLSIASLAASPSSSSNAPISALKESN